MKHKALSLALAALLMLLTALMSGCVREEPASGGDSVKNGTYLLTVDGYGVTEEEFLLFLRDQKAITANYFWTNYQMQPDAEFWTSEVNGEKPIDYAKERALAAVIQAREEFILAAERKILEYQDFNGMMTGMEAENADRASKRENGEEVYGVSEFTPFTYYQYLNGNARSELERSQEELSKPTQAQLREAYEANKETLTLGTVYSYEVAYADGRTEQVSQNTREIGKEDTVTEDLILNYFSGMKLGEVVRGYSYHGETADITLRSVENLGYQSFEEAQDSLRVFVARSELNELIASRVQAAKVVFDQARYDALEMP